MRLAYNCAGSAPIEIVYLRRGCSADTRRARHLATLGLEPMATAHDAKAARRRLVRELHPDRTGNTEGEERLALVNAAFDAIALEASDKLEASDEPDGVVERDLVAAGSFRDVYVDAQRTLFVIGPAARFTLIPSGGPNTWFECDRLVSGTMRERSTLFPAAPGATEVEYPFALRAREQLRVTRRINE